MIEPPRYAGEDQGAAAKAVEQQASYEGGCHLADTGLDQDYRMTIDAPGAKTETRKVDITRRLQGVSQVGHLLGQGREDAERRLRRHRAGLTAGYRSQAAPRPRRYLWCALRRAPGTHSRRPAAFGPGHR